MPLPLGREVVQQDGPLSHVLFPTSGMVSLVVLMEDGRVAEASTVGREGIVGVSAMLSKDSSPATATSQVAGEALSMPVHGFLEEIARGGTFERLVRSYAAYTLRYANQTVACNLLHSVEERMCRWLLMIHDRTGSDEFPFTHELLSEMLGVRRQTVTVIAGELQNQGLIQYRRGILRILDREGLEAGSCECYSVIKDAYDRLVQ
ncbi:MAG TPA: Crp/Fnr family transcriptional regulator [Thermoanaerobaculia bacterium]